MVWVRALSVELETTGVHDLVPRGDDPHPASHGTWHDMRERSTPWPGAGHP